MRAANKVALNTGILYGRMLVTMGISLYSTRLVLDALGSTDFGIFSLVAGVIAMLSFLNAAMTTSTQRYLSYHQGKKDVAMQRKVFANSLWLHFLIGGGLVLVLEAIGFFLFDGFLNIPLDRVETAKIIYHFMSATVFFTVLAVPFNGSLTAHENMLWIAIVNIIETLLKLGIAFILFSITSDKLLIYGLLTSVISIVCFVLYAVFCFRKYEECSFEALKLVDKKMLRELTSFAGWNLFGSLCALGKVQGLAVLLNLFFGAVVNAAYAIAYQVSSQLNFFSATLLRALNPQIMKSEGANDRKRMLRLSMIASKFCFFLLAFVAIPCIFEMETILAVWLKNVPDYTATFCRLILIGTLTNQLTVGLQSAAQATGKIKFYQIVIGGFSLLNLPLSYLMLYFHFPAYSVLISFILIEAIACTMRLFFLRSLAGLSIKEYFNRVFLKEAIPVLLMVATCYLITIVFEPDYRFLITAFTSVVVCLVGIYFWGLCSDEKYTIHQLLEKLRGKLQPGRKLQTF
ncbi:MAG: oligosaccharide flippase family protein [Chitinophagaceae bacterium]|nr:oligosaccharide flippase family protein [Chitinophagaceae bacterium]